MTTEITRHIFDGGVLNLTGTDVASDNVLNEGRSCQSFRKLLGQEEVSPALGTVTLKDYEKVNGKRRIKESLPPVSHLGTLESYSYWSRMLILAAIGVPLRRMKTCRKINTSVGSLFRNGGFYIQSPDGGEINLFMLTQVLYYMNSSEEKFQLVLLI